MHVDVDGSSEKAGGVAGARPLTGGIDLPTLV